MSTTTKKVSRRTIMTGAAALPAVAVLPTVTAAVTTEPDPIFAAIETHRQIIADAFDVYSQFSDAEGLVNGPHPHALIAWRNYSHIGGSEIDRAREKFLEDSVAAPETIEREYREKKAEYRAALRTRSAWEKRHGIAPLRKRWTILQRTANAAAQSLSNTKPTSVAGASALVAYAKVDIEIDLDEECGWPIVALSSAVAALDAIAAAAATTSAGVS